MLEFENNEGCNDLEYHGNRIMSTTVLSVSFTEARVCIVWICTELMFCLYVARLTGLEEWFGKNGDTVVFATVVVRVESTHYTAV